jgi:hypothetical protein
MKIQLKLDAKLVKRRPYRLNPKYKEKVRKELDQMLDAGIIVLVEESIGLVLWLCNLRKPMIFEYV